MFSKIKSFMTNLITDRKFCVTGLAVLSAAVITFVGVSVGAVPAIGDNNKNQIYSLATRRADIRPLSNTNLGDSTDLNEISRFIGLQAEDSIPVYVTMGNETVTVFVSRGQSVQDAIDLSGFVLDNHDSVSVSLLNNITDTMYIDVVDIEYETEVYEESIPYGTKKLYSTKLANTSVKEGITGVKEITCETKIVNGVAKSQKIVKETVISEPVDEIVTIGMKNGTSSSFVDCISTLVPSSPIRLDANGVPVRYKKHVTVQATAYTYTGNNCASGMAPQPGCVAINTDIFPFGTKFYIKSSDGQYIYGYAIAADTGGFLKTRPTNFDLFFETEEQCRKFGRRNIEVYVLY